ncbi:hypothetical protein EWM64_g8164 [Hericium alpestre]|uniref:Uncharacterized protein n=1 Tax=Hericium alpestre TaxID=135208 RepID=A0A4Y9ZP65_9AGAM|nr:hypothetical protein EWM64_g8164 [Hericium alpestre]
MAAGGPVVLGAKPEDGDAGVHYYTVPDSNLSIRIWSGGLATFGQYCLDFYDRGKKEAVNTPDGY